jgi:multidrug efflux pump subunit AcrA (membrane-fusion protein)
LTAYRGLLPGYFARIRIPVGTTKDALFVPDEAIGSKQGGRTLLVVNARDVVEQGVVGLGAKQGDWRVITPGPTRAIASSSTACSEPAPGKRLRLTIVLRDPPTRSRGRS